MRKRVPLFLILILFLGIGGFVIFAWRPPIGGADNDGDQEAQPGLWN